MISLTRSKLAPNILVGKNKWVFLRKFWERIWNVPATTINYIILFNYCERIYSNRKTFKKPKYLLQVLLAIKDFANDFLNRVCILFYWININKTNKVSRKTDLIKTKGFVSPQMIVFEWHPSGVTKKTCEAPFWVSHEDEYETKHE